MGAEIEIMHAATLHSVGVITKLYFDIFAAFKESMTSTHRELDRRRCYTPSHLTHSLLRVTGCGS